MATDETLTPVAMLRGLAEFYGRDGRNVLASAALTAGADALETNDALARDLAAAREECAAREADRVAAKNETTRLRESVAQLEAHWSTAGKFYDEVLADLRLDAEVAAREAGRAFDRERAALMAQITKLHGKLAGLRTRGAVEAVVAAQVKPTGVNPAEEIERVKDERDHALADCDAAESELQKTLTDFARLRAAEHDCSACTKRHIERVRLPDNREGRTFKLRIGSDEKLCETCGAPLPGSRVSAHLTINHYADGRPGEVFLALDRARRGDLAATFGHQLAVAISIGLQYGVPADVFASRMRYVRDESGGTVMREVDGRRVPTENPRTVGSLVDLIAVTLERFAATDDVSDPDTTQGG